MEIGQQIKRYRNELNFSQEELAEKVYVSRQTISNWENDKNYPDIKSLLLLSSVFHISLDTLVKGDLEDMREKIKASEVKPEDYEKFKKEARIFAVLFVYSLFLTFPIIKYLGTVGSVVGIGMWLTTFYYSFRVDRMKKNYDIKTYKEILAFWEGETLSQEEKLREEGKSKYQKFIMVSAFAIGGGLVAIGSIELFKLSMPWGFEFLALLQIANLVIIADSIHDKVKQKESFKIELLINVVIVLHIVLTLLVGLGYLNITPITYCVITLILGVLIFIGAVALGIFKESKEK